MAAKPYDPTLKALVETEPESWPALLGRPTGPTTVIDADVATVSGAADKVLRVQADPPYLLHLEFIAGHDAAALPRKLLVRNGLLEDRHETRVRSAAVLLRPEADSPQLSGLYERGFPGEETYLTVPLSGGARLAAAAGAVADRRPGPVAAGADQCRDRSRTAGHNTTDGSAPGKPSRRRRAEVVWAAAYLLLGLRYSPALAAELFRGVVSMKESSTYQAILEEGRADGGLRAVAEAKRMLRLQGEAAFGPPDSRTAAAIERLNDLPRLEEMLLRVRTAASWRELLGRPAPGRRG